MCNETDKECFTNAVASFDYLFTAEISTESKGGGSYSLKIL